MNASKTRLGRDEALALLAGVDTLVAMKGKKVDVFDLKRHRPDDETLLGKLLGPTGNLRAPTARVGTVLLVGFNADTYKQYLIEG